MTDITFVEGSTVELIDSMGGDDDVAMAAWVSFAGDDQDRLADRKGVGRLIKFLKREEHNSPFEHVQFKFRISTSIFVAREIFRHRTAKYNEQSGRYTVFKPVFYVPSDVRPIVQEGKAGAYTFVAGQPWLQKIVQGTITAVSKSSWKAYTSLLDLGVAKEVARMVLPVNLMTNFYMTIDARNLMHFLELRSSPQALYEIRDVAVQMEEFFKEAMPLTYEAWTDKNDLWAEFMEYKKNKAA